MLKLKKKINSFFPLGPRKYVFGFYIISQMSIDSLLCSGLSVGGKAFVSQGKEHWTVSRELGSSLTPVMN